MCNVPIRITVDSATKSFLKVSNLNIKYAQCIIEEQIVAHMAACYERSDFGKAQKSFLCYELTMPAKCEGKTITEQQITSFIQANNLCSVLQNGALGCGSPGKKAFDWKISQLSSNSNILIEYDALTKKVVVS
jgi:hypothetical protein